MSWQQNQTPNLDPYIHQSGNVLTDWYGWCLAYVQTAFNAGWAGSNAWDSWNNHTVNRHADWNLPSGVYVPIYFSGYHDLGHAAIYKDGEVWSSPVSHKPTADHWNSISEVEQHYGVAFVGWAEGLGGTQVAHWVDDTPPYTISAMEPKQIHVKANMYKWNLAQPDFAAVCNNPITTSGTTGMDFTAVATLTRSDAGFQGYTYYLDDANTPHGWNSLDCEDVVVPPPMPTPYVPPAAPVTVKLAETYAVVTTCMYFDTKDDAYYRKNAKGTVATGKYYVYEKAENTIQLGKTNSKPDYWINVKDNVVRPNTTRLDPPEMDKPVDTPNPTPIPEDINPATMNWRGTIDLRYAGMYVFWNHNKEHDETAQEVDILDLETGQVKKKTANGTYAQFSGKVKWSDGNWYGRMKDSDGSFHWYAAHIEDLYPYNDVYGTQTTRDERKVLHNLTALDKLELGIAKIKTLGHNIWDVVAPKGK